MQATCSSHERHDERTVSMDRSIGRTIPSLFALHVRATPDATALIDRDNALTYAELDVRSNRLAKILRERGVVSGDCVGVAFERSIDLPVALLAILKVGAAYVPLDLQSSVERVRFVIGNAGITSVLTRGPCCEPSLFDGIAVIDLVGGVPLAETDAGDEGEYLARLDTNARAYVMYTSGSTGAPKGVAVSHGNVARLVCNANYCDMSPGHTFLHFAPLAFDASTFEIWAPLLNGATLAIARAGFHTIEELAEAIDIYGVTTLWLTTALFNRVVETDAPGFARLQHVLTGGDAGSARHLRTFLDRYPTCRLTNGYGPTENTTFSTYCDYTTVASIGDDPPIGRPISGSTAYILDENLKPIRQGTIGELCVGGDGVALGYVGLPDLNARRFVPDPYSDVPGARMYRTGDRVRLRDDGLIAFVGRVDDQVKMRGYRIELGEIESVLAAREDVLDVAVVVAAASEEKELVAYAVARKGSTLQPLALRSHLAARVPSYMVPHRFEILEAMPQHMSGKLDRLALAARAAASLTARRGCDKRPALRPMDNKSLKRTVAACWRDVLGEDVADDVNFFDAGGDSLRLLKLHELLGSSTDRKITATELFEYCTIKAQSELLAARQR